MSIRIYVGNLPKESIDRQELQDMFAEVDSVSTKVIKDRKTGKCRGFAFVTVPTDEIANEFIEKFNGKSFKDTPLKIEKALPKSKAKGDKEESGSGGSNHPAPRKGGNKKSRRGNNNYAPKEVSQPDPRWADELAKLKEMLAAQAK